MEKGGLEDIWGRSSQPPEAIEGLGAKFPASGGWGLGAKPLASGSNGVWEASP